MDPPQFNSQRAYAQALDGLGSHEALVEIDNLPGIAAGPGLLPGTVFDDRAQL